MSIEEFESVGKRDASRISFDNHELDEVAERCGEHYADFIFDPTSDEDATEKILAKREEWRIAGATVVLTSGVYDLLHHDHKGYLLHTKLAGAANHYMRNYGNTHASWNELTDTERRKYSDAFILSGELRLIVSVDGDYSVSNRKGGKSDIAGSTRPITGWLTRARSVVDVTQPFKTESGWERRAVVDAVTIHGPDDFEPDSPHASIIDLASVLQPDVWAIYEESEDILRTAPLIPALGTIALQCIPVKEGITYFSDSIIGRFSTTAILRRAKGEL